MLIRYSTVFLFLTLVVLPAASRLSADVAADAVQHPEDEAMLSGETTTNAAGEAPLHPHRTLSTLRCPHPDRVFYNANFHLETEHPVVCTRSELNGIGSLLNVHFDLFPAYDSELGNIRMDSCPLNWGRKLANKVGNDDMTDSLSAEPPSEEELLGESGETVSHHRNLGFLGHIWRGGGACNFCRAPTARRQLTEEDKAPGVTIVVRTDSFPKEMSYKIKRGAHTVFTFDGFTEPHREYTRTVHLEAGETYTFVAHDSYGDGWCCKYGKGGAQIYAGTTNHRLVNLDHPFENVERIHFEGPHDLVHASIDEPEVEDSVDEPEVVHLVPVPAPEVVHPVPVPVPEVVHPVPVPVPQVVPQVPVNAPAIFQQIRDQAQHGPTTQQIQQPLVIVEQEVFESSSGGECSFSTSTNSNTIVTVSSGSCTGGGCSVTATGHSVCDHTGCSGTTTVDSQVTLSNHANYSGGSTSGSCTVYAVNQAFPHLEDEISSYLSTVLQQEYNHKHHGHCLQGSFPTVNVELSAATERESTNYC